MDFGKTDRSGLARRGLGPQTPSGTLQQRLWLQDLPLCSCRPAAEGARLAIRRVTVLIGDGLETVQRFVRAVPRSTTLDELETDELPRRAFVDADVLDADDDRHRIRRVGC